MRNVDKIVAARLGKMDRYYEFTNNDLEHLAGIFEKGGNLYYTIICSFVYGYEMGVRATKAERKKRKCKP